MSEQATEAPEIVEESKPARTWELRTYEVSWLSQGVERVVAHTSKYLDGCFVFLGDETHDLRLVLGANAEYVRSVRDLGVLPSPSDAGSEPAAPFEIPDGYVPRQGDQVEAWLTRMRDQFEQGDSRWVARDDLREDYRALADDHVPLKNAL